MLSINTVKRWRKRFSCAADLCGTGGTLCYVLTFGWAVLVGGLGSSCAARAAVSGTDGIAAAAAGARVSIQPFPYDLTAEAVSNVTSIVRDNANLYTVQLDNGIPWEAALAGSAFDAGLMDQWRRHKESIAPHHQVYLAIGPLADDRTSWAPDFQGKKAPAWAGEERRLNEQFKTAYTKYVLRAIEYFQPAYLNVGVEAGDMAAKKPSKWPVFEALYAHVVAEVRAKYPSLKIGISSGLPLLQKSGVLERVKKVIDQSDYVGISFYPYMSEFYVKLGADPLPAPPDQWRKPLEWLHQNVRKPIAICETGYSSEPVNLTHYGLKLQGGRDLQSQYVADLATIAQRDHYLFTVFFLAVDYDALMKKIRPGDETPRLWGRTGFFDTNLMAKPAWSTYLRTWLNRGKAPVQNLRVVQAAGTGTVHSPSGGLAFATPADLFVAPTPDKVQLQTSPEKGSFMRWTYRYRAGQFAWAVKELPAGSAKGSQGLVFELRSDGSDPLLLQVEESDGEAFYHVVKPGQVWTSVNVAWSEFCLDPGKKRDGVLDTGRIVRIMLADGAAVDRKATGGREVDIAQMGFRRGVETK